MIIPIDMKCAKWDLAWAARRHHRPVELGNASTRWEGAGGAGGDIIDTEVRVRHV